MQLDQARIAIYERSWADNLDLALQVLRTNAGPIVVCALATIVPFALLNHWLLGLMFPDPFAEDASVGSLYWLMILVLIESPLATAPITLYLGQATFVEKPSLRQVWRDYLACLPQLLLLQFLLRAVLIVPLITWIVPYGMWPYLNEVILLERNPLVGKPGRISTLKRNSLLHRGGSGDYLLRGILAFALSSLLVLAIYLTEDMLVRNLFGFEPGAFGWLVELQVAYWLVAVYFTAVRFLSYLDGRIRNEGWEVELLLRGQRARLTRQIA